MILNSRKKVINQENFFFVYSIRQNHTKNNNASPISPNEDRGYMKRRLEQLAEDAVPSIDDPNAGIIKDALPYNKIELHKKLSKIENNPSNFQHQYQQAIGISKLPRGTSKHSRDIAMAKPWNGIESHYDSSLRMLKDSIKPMKGTKRNGTSNTIITPPTAIRDRIHNAKEGALDYKLAKISEKKIKDKENDNDDGWSEMYKERLLGPSMLLNDSFASVDNSIKSLADQKIMDAQRRGEFKNIKRGGPLEKGYGAMENMFIDRTEYHLNKILKKQDALPPWIEKQSGCDLKILRFRQELDTEWEKWALNAIKDEYPRLNDEELIVKMKELCNNELDENKSLPVLRGKRWMESRGAYLDSQIRELNNVIRGYNLQAPLASQKMYLLLDKELLSCYKRVAIYLVDALKRHIRGDEETNIVKNVNLHDLHSYGGLPQRENIHQQETESISSMFKKMFW